VLKHRFIILSGFCFLAPEEYSPELLGHIGYPYFHCSNKALVTAEAIGIIGVSPVQSASNNPCLKKYRLQWYSNIPLYYRDVDGDVPLQPIFHISTCYLASNAFGCKHSAAMVDSPLLKGVDIAGGR